MRARVSAFIPVSTRRDSVRRATRTLSGVASSSFPASHRSKPVRRRTNQGKTSSRSAACSTSPSAEAKESRFRSPHASGEANHHSGAVTPNAPKATATTAPYTVAAASGTLTMP